MERFEARVLQTHFSTLLFTRCSKPSYDDQRSMVDDQVMRVHLHFAIYSLCIIIVKAKQNKIHRCFHRQSVRQQRKIFAKLHVNVKVNLYRFEGQRWLHVDARYC